MANPIRKPNALLEIRTGEQTGSGSSTRVHGWNYGEVWQRTEGSERAPHPAFTDPTGRPQQLVTFDIELLSNNIESNFHTHLACYTGQAAFCFRAHRGHDNVGVAQRRDSSGGLYLTECNPQKCALRQNHENPGSRLLEIKDKWHKTYPWGKLLTSGGKGPVAAKCMPYNFLIFNLLQPDGSYAHPEGECCMLATHSETTHGRILETLERLFLLTDGKLAGLRLKLCFKAVKTQHSRDPKPAWELRIPEGELQKQRVEAAQRIAARSIDFLALPPEALSTALVKAHEGDNIALWVANEYPEAMKPSKLDQYDYAKIQADKLDIRDIALINQQPVIQQLIKRCGTSYAVETRLPLDFGDNLRGCVQWFVKFAGSKGIDITDILAGTEFNGMAVPALPGGSNGTNDGTGSAGVAADVHGSDRAAVPADARDSRSDAGGGSDRPEHRPEAEAAEIQEAEFTEIPEGLEGAVKGEVAPDPLTKTPEELAEIEAMKREGLF